MPDARYRPPAAAEPAGVDGTTSRPWLRAVALLLIPVLAWAWFWLETELRWPVYDHLIAPLLLQAKGHVWQKAAVFVIAFGAIDVALALVAYRTIAHVYGRWAPLVAAIVVMPYVTSRFSYAMGGGTLPLTVAAWLHVVTAALPLAWMTWHRRRRLVQRDVAALAPAGG